MLRHGQDGITIASRQWRGLSGFVSIDANHGLASFFDGLDAFSVGLDQFAFHVTAFDSSHGPAHLLDHRQLIACS